jgi:hypothetical protein
LISKSDIFKIHNQFGYITGVRSRNKEEEKIFCSMAFPINFVPHSSRIATSLLDKALSLKILNKRFRNNNNLPIIKKKRNIKLKCREDKDGKQ